MHCRRLVCANLNALFLVIVSNATGVAWTKTTHDCREQNHIALSFKRIHMQMLYFSLFLISRINMNACWSQAGAWVCITSRLIWFYATLFYMTLSYWLMSQILIQTDWHVIYVCFLYAGKPRYVHLGEEVDGVDMRAEVGLLSRNILVRGEMESSCYGNEACKFFDFDTFGGHLKVGNYAEGVAQQVMWSRWLITQWCTNKADLNWTNTFRSERLRSSNKGAGEAPSQFRFLFISSNTDTALSEERGRKEEMKKPLTKIQPKLLTWIYQGSADGVISQPLQQQKCGQPCVILMLFLTQPYLVTWNTDLSMGCDGSVEVPISPLVRNSLQTDCWWADCQMCQENKSALTRWKTGRL